MAVLEFPALEESSTVEFFHDRAELSAQDFFGRPRPDLAPDLAQDGLLKAHIQLSSDRIWTEIHATVTDFLAACRWIDAGELDVLG